MTVHFAPAPSATERLEAALRRLTERHAFTRVDAAFEPPAGTAVLLLSDDPQRSPEALDVIVVLPEALRALGRPLSACVADAEASAVLARRFGVARLPAVVAFRDGAWLGAFSGILDWAPFVTELARLLDAPPGRPPIFVASAEARP
ncbi:MAG TPA: hypothetical protein PLN96_13950 [Zoogloea sp.]|uniref:hypothetical protein n=1 Tax=Zoogloea sp. TaxID=49181 RepID=UPI002B61F4EB|nr:hypothetical protein [Zoogloea sp.]HMW50510.1 hypothetical protein [Rhodocyclaceae bacterium]HMY50674.1 hypothetical protein [Rhodocyclaceae bacterium]HMZ76841.1 hypothetical protein [Rhodocyclaceae bacterium]HNA68915.1 hypothetical protein [Rhodocyclaceae bacterium]HNB63388.1 hypothetical protein [Rhodocyclaceae bacterium]